MKRSLLLLSLACAPLLRADDAPPGPDGKPRFGHSSHGEAFDEGPRQAAVLLEGIGSATFEVASSNAEAAKFFNQGVGQLHGFWYYEAERSFRQAAKLDPDLAMAYWGMALANLNHEKRAADFIKKAVEKKAKASPREQEWIAAYEKAFGDGKNLTHEKRKALVKALEKIVFDYPADLEAKAFLAFHVWDNSQKGIPLSSHTMVDSLAQHVLAANPQHPGIHHYLIHLWNYEDDRRAMKSAGALGQSAPGVAHMWHMPGHTFTRLKRFADAAWQQEASARTDHAYMMTARILPEQIHNYAHNNDWLVETLGFTGRVRDAADLAKNMIELPRLAPGHVLIGKDGYRDERSGFQMGRKRLLDLLVTWGKWDELLELENSHYLEVTDAPLEDARRLRALGVAAFNKGNKPKGEEKLAALDAAISKLRTQRFTDAETAEKEAQKAGKKKEETTRAMADALAKHSDAIATLERYRDEVRLHQLIAESRPMAEIKPALDAAKEIAPVRLSRIYLKLGDTAKALEHAEKAAKDSEGQVLPLANLADVQWRAGKKDEAAKSFEKLRPLCAQADLGDMAFTRLKPIVDHLKLPPDWRPKLEWTADTGARPDLAKLGPFRWMPGRAPDWQGVDQNGKTLGIGDYKGRAHLVVFYLGSGCSHCIEQLNVLGPMTEKYREAGIEIVALSSDTAADLNKTFVQAKGAQGFTFPIVSDSGLGVFKGWRAFDDFENQALHGTFLVDAAGYVRWQDISAKPFTQIEWLLGESKRLLALPVKASGAVAAAQ